MKSQLLFILLFGIILSSCSKNLSYFTKDIQDEIGDILFTVVNISRKLGFDAETCLRKTIGKFEYRFHKIEEHHKENNEDIAESSLEKLDEIWNNTKKKDI